MRRTKILVFASALFFSIALVSGINVLERSVARTVQPHLQRMLDTAADRGEVSRMKLLILLGADVNGRAYPWVTCGNATEEDIARSYQLPIHSAAYKGQTKAVELLLDKGANVNATDGYGQTALWHVALGGHADTARLLILRGADVNPSRATYSLTTTPLEQATEEEAEELVKVLLQHGAKE